jgi:hypothetical protein
LGLQSCSTTLDKGSNELFILVMRTITDLLFTKLPKQLIIPSLVLAQQVVNIPKISRDALVKNAF